MSWKKMYQSAGVNCQLDLNSRFLVLVICCCYILSICDAAPFNSTPILKMTLGSSAFVNTIGITSDESMVLVSYDNNTMIGYNMKGQYLVSFTGPNSLIQQIQWISGVGPLCLTNSGNIFIWYANGTFIGEKVLTGSNPFIEVSSSAVGNFLAICYGSYIQEYSLGSLSFQLIQTYNAPNGTSFLNVMYGYNHQYIFGVLNTTQLIAYNCENGLLIDQPFTTPDSGNIQSLALFTYGNYLLMQATGPVYMFSVNSTSLTTKYLVNYLVSIDINGNLFVDTYTQTQDPSIFITKFARWILWVIIGCGSFLVVVIVVVIIICCRRKRRAKGLNNTIKEEFSVKEGKFGKIYEENDWNNSTNRYKNDSKRVSELQDMTAPNYHQKPNRNN